VTPNEEVSNCDLSIKKKSEIRTSKSIEKSNTIPSIMPFEDVFDDERLKRGARPDQDEGECWCALA